jgi:hypothetical protein
MLHILLSSANTCGSTEYVCACVCVCARVCVSHIQEWYKQCSASNNEQFQNKRYSANCVHTQSVSDEIVSFQGWVVFFNNTLFATKIWGVWYKAEMFEVEAAFGKFDDVLASIWNARECPQTFCPHTHKHNAGNESHKSDVQASLCALQLHKLDTQRNANVSAGQAAVSVCHWGHEAVCPDTMGCKLLEIWTLAKYLPITLFIHKLWHTHNFPVF